MVDSRLISDLDVSGRVGGGFRVSGVSGMPPYPSNPPQKNNGLTRSLSLCRRKVDTEDNWKRDKRDGRKESNDDVGAINQSQCKFDLTCFPTSNM
jgi:hypothetical protein